MYFDINTKGNWRTENLLTGARIINLMMLINLFINHVGLIVVIDT